jgi:hypothetical protein
LVRFKLCFLCAYATLLLACIILPRELAAQPGPTGSPTASATPVKSLALSVPVKLVTVINSSWGKDDSVSCISFKNVSDKTLVAVEFVFSYIDAFNKPIAHYKGDIEGIFSPGVLIKGETPDYAATARSNCWKSHVVFATASRVDTDVAQVLYRDGTVWVNRPLAVDSINSYAIPLWPK